MEDNLNFESLSLYNCNICKKNNKIINNKNICKNCLKILTPHFDNCQCIYCRI